MGPGLISRILTFLLLYTAKERKLFPVQNVNRIEKVPFSFPKGFTILKKIENCSVESHIFVHNPIFSRKLSVPWKATQENVSNYACVQPHLHF